MLEYITDYIDSRQ